MTTLLARIAAWLRARAAARPLAVRGEEAAASYLRRRGYRILGRRLRSELGEIDLVALDGRTVVFVEVKTRQSAEAGHPADTVDRAKQRRLTRLAVAYLKRHGLLEASARFDVVAVTWPEGERRPTIEHIKSAYDAAGRWEFYS
jgi:putative endonuclease